MRTVDPVAVALAAAVGCSVARAEAYLRAHHERLAAAWRAVLPPPTRAARPEVES